MALRVAAAPPPPAATGSALPTPLAPSGGTPDSRDVRMFDTGTLPIPPAAGLATPGGPAAPAAPGTGDTPAPRRRRRGVLLGAAGAVVAVVGAAGYAAGLFSYESPSRNGALPDEVRASVPDTVSGTPEASAVAPSGTASPSPTVSPPASAPVEAGTSTAPSASAPATASPTAPATASREPTAPPTSAPATPTADPVGPAPDEDGGPVLSRGSRGPAVTELQQRLNQLHLYTGRINGSYTHQVEDSVRVYQWARGIRGDGLGVYGPDTRRALEAETRTP
ncbi:peptidoglycan-binding protein [Streptomyces sp. SCSIO 75703]|uniref:peptidoglycan-binding domain-containing protein n=1 Tax=unclassified Streptomyces TaxID=2593676 RepID=UPI001F17F155|nr:peptidoglycan-binding domain-containing protein [Streptomyces sp. TP-A0875]